MKQLVINTGIAAATSIAFTALAPIPEARAFDLVPESLGILVNNGTQTLQYDLEGRTAADGFEFFNDPGVIEVGEFGIDETTGAELRGYVEFDLAPFIPTTDEEAIDIASNTYSISFDILSQGGSGTSGDGTRNNLGNAYTGAVDVLWYIGTAIEELDFTPVTPDEQPLTDDLGGILTPAVNPLASFTIGSEDTPGDFSVGDTVTVDVTDLVRNLLLEPFGLGTDFATTFGILLKATDLTNPGMCGGDGQAECVGATFNGFGVTAVPTPAAILPTLFGLAGAAFRKKKVEGDVDA